MDLASPYDPNAIKGSTAFVTGGASGIGAAMVERFAELGAHVIVADINTALGESLVASLRSSTGNENHHFVRADVSSFPSLSDAFSAALRLSPSGHIHHVIANAGISESEALTDLPSSPSDPCPPPPTSTLSINLLGIFYTTRLALHHMRLNDPATEDAHLLLVGSMASFLECPPNMAEYAASKHGVLGLFHSLRLSPGDQAPPQFRVNLLCPYFIETPILPTSARVLLAGVETAKKEDAVDAVTMLCAEREKAKGRCLVIAPRGAGGVQEMDWMELKDIEPFTKRIVGLINGVGKVKRGVGIVQDMMRLMGVWWSMAALGVVTAIAATVVIGVMRVLES